MAELNCTTLFNDSSLKAYYRFQTGALTTDSSPNGITLTNVNTVLDATGMFGGGADFTAANTNKRLTYLTTDLGIAVTDPQSYSFWAKRYGEITNTGTQQEWMFTKTTANPNSFYYAISYEWNSGTPRLRATGRNADGFYTTSLGTDWHHFVLTHNAGTVTMYLDAVNRIQYTNATPIGPNTYSQNLTLGAYNIDIIDHPYKGIIDDFAVFNKTLSQAEVTKLYSGTCDRFGGGFLLNMI